MLLNNTFLIQTIPEKPKVEAKEPIDVKREVQEKAKEKYKLAEEAKKRAQEAKANEKKADAKVEEYKTAITSAQKAGNKPAEISAQLEQQKWIDTATKEKDTQKTEKENEKKLKEEGDALLAEENKLAESFSSKDEKTEEKDSLEEKFEDCVKGLIEKFFNNQKITKQQSTKVQEYTKQLSEKLAQLTVYERINFLNSDTTSAKEWDTIHKEALAPNDKNYDEPYKALLEEIAQLKKLIENLVGKKDLDLPTTKDNDECFILSFPGIDQDIKNIETKLTEDMGSWND